MSAPSVRKRAVNVSLDPALLDEAKAAGLNVSGVLHEALRAKLKAHREAAWRAENRAAIEASNAELEKNGLWCDDLRPW